MQKTISLLREQLIGIRSDNLSAAVVETVRVEYHGELTPIRYVAAVVERDRRISVTPYDRGIMDIIEQTLKKCGFSAYKFSKQEVVVNVPLPTGEEAEKTYARIRKIGEDAKVAIRNLRKKHRQLKNEQDNDELEDLTRSSVNEIDSIVNDKIESLKPRT